MKKTTNPTPSMKNPILLSLLGASALIGTTASVQAASISMDATDGIGQASFTNGTNWEDNAAPTSGNDYFTAGFTMRTPETTGDKTFAGDSLTLNGGGVIYKGSTNGTQTITINNLTFSDGAFSNGSGVSGRHVTLAGNNMEIADGKYADFNATNLLINVSASIGGGGELRVRGDGGTLNLQGINTYTGDTKINHANTTLNLVDDAGLLFQIGASGVNNWVTGVAGGNVNFNGDFTFNLALAAASGTWNIVDVATLDETYGSTFTVKDFTEDTSGVWTRTIGASTYTFTESTGVLSAIPEPSAALLGGLGLLALLRRRR
jgi:hypothetical protein